VSHPDRAVRASDAEREDVSRQLSAHAAAGRLTPQELDERLDAAYAARTYGSIIEGRDVGAVRGAGRPQACAPLGSNRACFATVLELPKGVVALMHL
jgi:hypothetical protein